jgi:hypothetical protein
MSKLHKWSDISANLNEPFNPYLVRFRVGSISYDKKSAKAFAFVDPREYQTRLDDVCGAENWQSEYRSLGNNGIICRIKIRGLNNNNEVVENYQEEIGEFEEKDSPKWMNASSQAFKRTCASFGLGRYLYGLKERYYPLKESEYANATPRFVDIEYIRKDLLMNTDVSIEQRRRVEERVISLMSEKFSHELFEMPT